MNYNVRLLEITFVRVKNFKDEDKNYYCRIADDNIRCYTFSRG